MGNKIIQWAAILFCFVLPLSTKLANVALGIFLVAALCLSYKNIARNRGEVSLKQITKLFFCTTAVFIFLLTLGLLYTDYFSVGVKYYENFSSYLLVPVILGVLRKEQLKAISEVCFSPFFYGCLLSAVVLLAHNFIRFFSAQQGVSITPELFGYEYTYHKFTSLLKFHPTFIGFYFTFALAIALKQDVIKQKWYIKLVGCVVLLLCILFLNSRSTFLLTALVFSFYLIHYLFYSNVARVKTITLFVLGLFLAVATFQSMRKTYVYERLTHELKWELTENKGTKYNDKYANDSRMARWKAIFYGAMENPVWGTGSGSEMATLQKIYHKNDLKYASKLGYGSHNQYLTVLVENGLVGVLLMLMYFGYNIWQAIRKRNLLYMYFFSAIVIASFFDTVLYVNTSIIFVAFFANLFTISTWKERRENSR